MGGLIDANSTGNTLTIDPNGSGVTNQGTLRASGGGNLVLEGGDYASSNTIEAVGADSEVQLIRGASVVGGAVRGTGGGLVRANTSANVFFTDVTFEGAVQSNDNTDFGISGTITNNATITMQSNGNATDIEVQTGVATLTGTGKVVLTKTSSNVAGIDGIGNAVLRNAATHTIEGQGRVGQNSIGIINQGLIDANVTGQSLTIDPNSASEFDNSGTVQASSGGVIELTGSGNGDFRGSGVYEALAGSEIVLANAVVRNTTFSTSGDGLVRTNASTNNEFHNVTNSGVLEVRNNTDLRIHGTITNSGTIDLVSAGLTVDLELGADATLTGGGTVTLLGSATRINSIANNAVLTNSDNLIEGSGPSDAPLVNNGNLIGTSAASFFETNNRLGGDGAIENVRIDGVHAPGRDGVIDTASVSQSGE